MLQGVAMELVLRQRLWSIDGHSHDLGSQRQGVVRDADIVVEPSRLTEPMPLL